MEETYEISIEAMGTKLSIRIWDALLPDKKEYIKKNILEYTIWFDETFSRFKENSLVTKISQQSGLFSVPTELVEMLLLYIEFEKLTEGAMNPLVGNTLVDLGYDSAYTLKKREKIRLPKKIQDVLEIVDTHSIRTREAVLIDLGALGKGYWVDKIKEILFKESIQEFLINGSGDIYVQNNQSTVKIGLENPFELGKVLGTIDIQNQSICGSAVNRRAWSDVHHVMDARTGVPVKNIVSTWALSSHAAFADAMATALFFEDPKKLKKYSKIGFEYFIVYEDGTYAQSKDFKAEIFTT